MTPQQLASAAILAAAPLLFAPAAGHAAESTIHATHRHAYGANVGWIDWRADGTNGAVIGDYVCAGHLYSANVGWIHLGSGTPSDGLRYGNSSADDYGVNHDGFGNLSGFAYGANIGWIRFDAAGAPRVDLKTGRLDGAIYSANCGWISLSNSSAFVQTGPLWPGPLSATGLPLGWELEHFQDKNIDPGADPDGDGLANAAEYHAGTDPTDAASVLRIVSLQLQADGTKSVLRWTSVSNRCYQVFAASDLVNPTWVEAGLGVVSPDGPVTERSLANPPATNLFFRVQALKTPVP